MTDECRDAITPDAVVAEFYDAVTRRDSDRLARLIDAAFHPDVVLMLPDSLPYGGAIRGAERVRRALLGAAGSPKPVGPHQVAVTSVCSAATNTPLRIAVELEFVWYAPGAEKGIASGAVEMWSFDATGMVVQIRAYYADTAALVAATNP